ncbi:MAG: hypothetical protein JW891_06445 [Candidatus Lokiarchaeota archaeon]|nr:hypothetical protein [Candidatus Lokiarchaeota archaeon]
MEVLNAKKTIRKTMSIYLVNYNNENPKIKDVEDVLKYFNDKTINFATVDVPDDFLISFRNSPLPGLLRSLGISYYQIKIPEETKTFFLEKLRKIEKHLTQDQEEFALLEDKNSARGRYLKFWIELYQKELQENKEFFEQKVRPVYIAETMIGMIEGMMDQNILLLHFGDEKTFSEIMKVIKYINEKIDVSYLHYIV